jgi:TM2 domain-containing membrane protein YozV
MKDERIEGFIAAYNENFAPKDLIAIRNYLKDVDDSKLILVQSLNYKKPLTVFLVSLFFGPLGADRFMLGQIGLGIIKLLTLGGLLIWTIIDWIVIMGKTRELNYRMLMNVNLD